MNPYTKNINRIELVITYACTGRCKHCSEGDHAMCGESIDADIAAKAVYRLAEEYKIKSLMTFGGEPLLYPEAVCKIHSTAKAVGILKRQLITNGFFSTDRKRIAEVAENLAKSGVNDILLSVDAFHQETIPLEPVKVFAQEVKAGVSIRTSPAWLVSKTDDNSYNQKTREVLNEFRQMGISEADGNVVFPSGNALKYLSEYFDPNVVFENPYEEDPNDIRAISIEPDGRVLGGNAYVDDICEIINKYKP
ncbi:MAG: radical SAM protein [Oscillospiraceae bacterium]|nr:radical SAM protein [Oscillospiraceae bacterium]